MVSKKVLLIDMYGVIIKESKGYFIPYTFQHFDVAQHERLTRQLRDEQLFTKAGNGYLTSDEFLTSLGYDYPNLVMKDYLEHYLTLDEGFVPFASHLHDELDIVLLSNDVLEWSEYLTSYHNLNPFFSDKIISGAIHMRKPNKDIYEYTLKRLHKSGEQCIFVDNSSKNLEVAKEFGIHSIRFNREQEEFDGDVVDNFSELEQRIKSIC